ncbi:universal stress protein [Terracidiphilus gabretensis]|uniref:universal stress protein n=1 Tax=Terracidiphilus gabretensis TaxID=1577687 RepID=UPI00071B0C8F|nr:universal stress protein [Terracidiphilus gabretensis]
MTAAPKTAVEDSSFKTVLVAADLSHPASQALRYARSIAQAYEAMTVIVHCIDPVAYAFPEGAPESVLADPLAREEYERIEAETRKQAFPLYNALESDVIYDRLCQAAQDCSADLMILGTRAVTVLGRLALGSVAMHLLAHAPCSVLCVPADAGMSEDFFLPEIEIVG